MWAQCRINIGQKEDSNWMHEYIKVNVTMSFILSYLSQEARIISRLYKEETVKLYEEDLKRPQAYTNSLSNTLYYLSVFIDII